MSITDGVLYDDYEQKCDECRRLRAEVERLKKDCPQCGYPAIRWKT